MEGKGKGKREGKWKETDVKGEGGDKTITQAVCEREGRGYYRSGEVRGCVRDGVNAKCHLTSRLQVVT